MRRAVEHVGRVVLEEQRVRLCQLLRKLALRRSVCAGSACCDERRLRAPVGHAVGHTIADGLGLSVPDSLDGCILELLSEQHAYRHFHGDTIVIADGFSQLRINRHSLVDACACQPERASASRDPLQDYD